MSNLKNSNNLLKEQAAINIEELKELPLSNRAFRTAERVKNCRSKHKVFDCPFCKDRNTVNCSFDRVFKIRYEHNKSLLLEYIRNKKDNRNKRTYSEVEEERINKKIDKWHKDS